MPDTSLRWFSIVGLMALEGLNQFVFKSFFLPFLHPNELCSILGEPPKKISVKIGILSQPASSRRLDNRLSITYQQWYCGAPPPPHYWRQ